MSTSLVRERAALSAGRRSAALLLALVTALAAVLGTHLPAAAASGDTLFAGQSLYAGDSLVSGNGLYEVAVQGDGNVVVYGSGVPRWWTSTSGPGAELALQGDGNLVLYAGGAPRWWTGTSGGDARLTMQGDGNLVLYIGGRAAWSSATGLIPVRPSGPPDLFAGQQLTAGQQLVSGDGRFVAALQGDGNFVVYGPGNAVLFASATGGTRNPVLALQGDGNLVLYGDGAARWQTGTSGGGAQLALQGDGNLVVYAGGRAAWSIKTGLIPVPQPTRSALAAGETLTAGQSLVNGRFQAAMQGDGNFVLYDGSRPVFWTGTGGTGGARLAMQADGNLVLYGSGGPRWQTGTSGGGAQLALQGDGNLVVYAGGRAAWSARTGYIPLTYVTFSGNGDYGIGRDIPAGTFRTRSAASGCYWERLRGFSGEFADIISNEITDFPTVVTIAPGDAGFSSSRCATWTSDLSRITASPGGPFDSGTYIVGTDITPGIWSAPGGPSCYWERLRGFSGTFTDLIANDFGRGGRVAIAASDAGFTTRYCGPWTRVG